MGSDEGDRATFADYRRLVWRYAMVRIAILTSRTETSACLQFRSVHHCSAVGRIAFSDVSRDSTALQSTLRKKASTYLGRSAGA